MPSKWQKLVMGEEREEQSPNLSLCAVWGGQCMVIGTALQERQPQKSVQGKEKWVLLPGQCSGNLKGNKEEHLLRPF